MDRNILSLLKPITPIKPLPTGIFHYQAPPDAARPYRLHLRIEPDGNSILIINASTILHLNQTATEYAYHLVLQTPEDKMLKAITGRYRVKREQALADYRALCENIQTLINTPDLDPETFLDFTRTAPYTQNILAPYRLDCALTYQLSAPIDTEFAPSKRVERELTTDEWHGVFDKAWSFGIPHIILTGGEPTLRSDLLDLIAHTEANGQIVGLLSDGVKMADDNYLQSLLQTGLDHVMIMLNPENEITWKSVEKILACDLFLSVHQTLTEKNVSTTPQVVEHLAQMGVRSISLSASKPDVSNSLEETRNKVASLGINLVWDLPVPYSAFNPIALETQSDNPPAGAGHAWLYIEPDGDVLPAQGVDQILGNILRDPWENLWR
jgi:organic radical activating enzyme